MNPPTDLEEEFLFKCNVCGKEFDPDPETVLDASDEEGPATAIVCMECQDEVTDEDDDE